MITIPASRKEYCKPTNCCRNETVLPDQRFELALQIQKEYDDFVTRTSQLSLGNFVNKVISHYNKKFDCEVPKPISVQRYRFLDQQECLYNTLFLPYLIRSYIADYLENIELNCDDAHHSVVSRIADELIFNESIFFEDKTDADCYSAAHQLVSWVVDNFEPLKVNRN